MEKVTLLEIIKTEYLEPNGKTLDDVNDVLGISLLELEHLSAGNIIMNDNFANHFKKTLGGSVEYWKSLAGKAL